MRLNSETNFKSAELGYNVMKRTEYFVSFKRVLF
jgi:hypothetical protein